MPKTYPAKTDFTRGKFSPLLEDRYDERIYQNGARSLENVFVLPHGGVTRRGGTRYSGLTRSSTGEINLEGFIFSENPKQSYVLEFGDKVLRFFWGYDKSLIIDPNSVDPLPKYAFVGTGLNDISMSGSYTGTENCYYKILIIDPEDGKDIVNIYINGTASTSLNLGEVSIPYTLTIDGINFIFASDNGHTVGDYWETEVYWPYTLSTPWTESVVKELRIAQREDVMFIVHPNYVPRKLSRYGHTDWSLEPWTPTKSPWQPTVGLTYKLYDSSYVWSSYGVHGTSKGYLDYYFDENSGASLIKSNPFESSISISLDNTYYSELTNDLRIELIDAIGDVEQVSIEIFGSIYIPEDGSYQFCMNCGRQASDLIIDGDVVASRYGKDFTPDNPASSTFQSILENRAGIVTLSAGEHVIRARCWIGEKLRTLAVYWKKPGDTIFELIPAKYFVEQSERYGVSCANYIFYDLDGDIITLPPVSQEEFDALFTTDTSGVSINQTGKWDDCISFHSQAGMSTNSFTADLPPSFIVDSTNHSLEISGYLSISEDGSYQFAVDGNDGCEFVLYDNSNNILASVIWISNINTQAQADGYTSFMSVSWEKHVSSSISLTSGIYPFRARYWSQLKGFAFSVAWLTPGETEFVVIPQSAITPNLGYYPRCITFHEQRIFVGGASNEPQRIYASKTEDFEDFTIGADADDGLELRIAADHVDAIRWIISKEVLYAGTVSTEYIIKGSSGVLTPDDIQVIPNTAYGSANINPVKAEDGLFFVDRSERVIREYSYVLEKDKSVGTNMSILAEDLFQAGIQKLIFQQGSNAAFRFGFDTIDDYMKLHSKLIDDPINTPYSLNILWALTNEGKLKSLTIEMLEKVYAWTEQVIGGTGVVVQSMTVIPGDGGDLFFLAVDRTIGGNTVRTIEWIDPTLLCDLGDVDYEIGGNTGLGSITLAHLPSESIRAIGLIISANGDITWEPICDRHNPSIDNYDIALDASGVINFNTTYWLTQSIVLSNRYQIIYAGYPFYCTIETLPFDVQIGQNMTSMGMMKRWVDIRLSVVNTTMPILALSAYPSDTELMDNEGELVTGRKRFFILGWDQEAGLIVTQDYPLPMTIRSIYGELQVNMG